MRTKTKNAANKYIEQGWWDWWISSRRELDPWECFSPPIMFASPVMFASTIFVPMFVSGIKSMFARQKKLSLKRIVKKIPTKNVNPSADVSNRIFFCPTKKVWPIQLLKNMVITLLPPPPPASLKKNRCYGVNPCYDVSPCYGISPCYGVSPCYTSSHQQ